MVGAALLALLVLPSVASAAPGVITTTPAIRQAAANAAVAKVGMPYLTGASGPRRFDCSGLVTFAYRVARHPLLARTSYDLFRHGKRITRAALRPGDLVWTWDRSLGHVGMYIGSGRYVHAPGTGRKVQVAPLPTGRAFVGAVRP
ncbi:MAG: putative secreted protein [Thermoleophilia bacterium]|nr:putative secreted protein [Thermoleophilia bacterium]